MNAKGGRWIPHAMDSDDMEGVLKGLSTAQRQEVFVNLERALKMSDTQRRDAQEKFRRDPRMESDKATVPDVLYKAYKRGGLTWLDVAKKVWQWSRDQEDEARNTVLEAEERKTAADAGGGGGGEPPYGSIQQPEDAFIARTRRLNMLSTKYNDIDGEMTLTHAEAMRERRRMESITRKAGMNSDAVATAISALGDLADRAEAQRIYEETPSAVKTGRSSFYGSPNDPSAVFKNFELSPRPTRFAR